MRLIVDSGSTKSDWVLLNNGESTHFETIGLSPYFHTEATVSEAIQRNEALFAIREAITEIHFYGTGCSSEGMNAIIRNGVSAVFQRARVFVDHDLMACAVATYEGEPAISCILGTGSNSCFFDGETTSKVVPSLGFVLGDEGSGAYFGKTFITALLYGEVPKEISDSIQEDVSIDEVLRRVYKESNANTYLASFMKTVFQFSDHPYIQQMIQRGFEEFVRIHVCCYDNYQNHKVHFIGSIAKLFEEQLAEACQKYNAQLGNVIQKPIDGLVKYHLERG